MAKTYKLPDGTVLDYQTAVKLYKAMEREFALVEMEELGDQDYFPVETIDLSDKMIDLYLEQVDTDPKIRERQTEIATSVLKSTLVEQIQTPTGMLKFLEQMKDTDGVSFVRTTDGVPEIFALDNDFSLVSDKEFAVADFRPLVQQAAKEEVRRLLYSGKPISNTSVSDGLIIFTIKA